MSKTVLVCHHQTCPQQGATSVLSTLKSQAPPDVTVKETGCLGECGNGPMLVILPEQIWYAHVSPQDVPKIIEQHLKGGKPVVEKLYTKYHPTKQSIKTWLLIGGAIVASCVLFFWFLASQTDYL